MKTPRTEVCVVVIGRNRRVYARMYKMEKFIEGFSKHCYENEFYKSFDEGFRPIGMSFEKLNDAMLVYRIQYEEIKVS